MFHTDHAANQALSLMAPLTHVVGSTLWATGRRTCSERVSVRSTLRSCSFSALVAHAPAGHRDGADVMSRFRMSPLGAAINLTTLLAVVAFWYWRRRKKGLALESAMAFEQPPSAS